MAILKAPITRNDHNRGPANAPITLVKYGDYECPHCGLAYPIVNKVLLSFSGRMRFVYQAFPSDRNTPARRDRGRKHGVRRRGGTVLGYARCPVRKPEQAEHYNNLPDRRRAWASRNSHTESLETGQYRNKVRSDFMGDVSSGVKGTPAFSSMAYATIVLTITPPWCRQSGCDPPSIPAHSGLAKAPSDQVTIR